MASEFELKYRADGDIQARIREDSPVPGVKFP